MKQKTILTLQDYSCLGRCSLTVALPTISASGIQAVGIPTGVLSNHTAFPEWTFDDTLPCLMACPKNWGEHAPEFSAIYTGYLATSQVDMALSLIHSFKKEGTLLFVDPACADGGELYPGFGKEHLEAMKRLFQEADLIKPNVTEACLLTATPYQENHDEAFCASLLPKLASLGPKRIVLSGVQKEGKVGSMVYDEGKVSLALNTLIPMKAHGTGDLFSSALVSALVLGTDLHEAASIAGRYVSASLAFNQQDGVDGILFGPEFEKAIPSFLRDLQVL